LTSRRAIQLAKRVEAWQKRLGPLGLSQYTIDAVSTMDDPGGNEMATACVHPSANYDRCRFEFRNEDVDWAYDNDDFEYLDQTILHEWVHVAFQAFENSIELVEDSLSQGQLDIWKEAMDHSREQLIDRIARQLYAAFKSDVVQ
jgi:hypothetical protein